MSRRSRFPWRSLLYVPAHDDRFVAGASTRQADATILDLEDGVPWSLKEPARAGLTRAVGLAGAAGAPVIVRVNRPWTLAWRDLEAAVAASTSGVLFPKVESAGQLTALVEYLEELESEYRQQPVAVLACVESALGLANVTEICRATERLTAVIPGNEDLAADLDVAPERGRMQHFVAPLVVAARAAGVMVLGSIGSGADFRDLDAYRTLVEQSLDWGFAGVTCIHPSQVKVVNDVFRPTQQAVSDANRLVTAFEAGDGRAIEVDGKMVDRPIYLRAKRLLELADGNRHDVQPAGPLHVGRE